MRRADLVTRTLRDVWQALPEELTDSRAARGVVASAKGRRGASPRVIRTLAELDDEISRLEQAVRTSDDDLRRGFNSFRMELDDRPPADPFSDSYRRWVLDLYKWLHGSPYETGNEMTPLQHEAAVIKPFPYLTANAGIVGDYLMAVGHVVRTLGLGPGSRVLEMGAGWGNVALPLAQLGCDVTALDVSAQYAAVIEDRANRLGLKIRSVVGTYGNVAGIGYRFDAVVFFESFHHSDDHLHLLADLHDVLEPGGRLVLAAEPVHRRFWAPWGPRLDGESLWAIRRNGWLELGFQRSYLLEALGRTGWAAQRFNCRATRWGDVLVATRA